MHYIELEKLKTLLMFDKNDPFVFSTSLFLFFFLALLLLLRLVQAKPRLRSAVVILFSLFFYYKLSGSMLVVLLASAVANYALALWIGTAKEGWGRRVPLLLGISANLGVLLYMRYTNFFLSSYAQYKGTEFVPLEIIVPVGISYFTFKAVSYLIDVYMEMTEATRNLQDFVLYMAFFPNVSIGPIDKARDFLPQITSPEPLTRNDISRAAFLIIIGLIKKNVIADYIGLNFVDRIFDMPLRYSGIENLIGIYGYTLQIYCDFSGYTDMAVGIALLLGYRIMENFNYPYQATSVAEFWRRWHISLSTWLLEYLFRPLQIKFRSMRLAGNALALLITFILCGFWHGPSWNFVLWGAVHGIIMSLSLLTQSVRRKIAKVIRLEGTPLLSFMQVVFTFHVVAAAWVLFRAPNMQVASDVFSQVYNFFRPGVFMQFVEGYPAIFGLMLFGFILHFLPKVLHEKSLALFSKVPLPLQAALLALAVYLTAQVKSADLAPFIYFQF